MRGKEGHVLVLFVFIMTGGGMVVPPFLCLNMSIIDTRCVVFTTFFLT